MRIKEYQKYLLYSVISLATLLRIFHNYNWRIWGSDSGEYLYLTRHLVQNGIMLSENYIGWGRAYPDFQGMQILVGSISLLTTIEYHYVLMWLIPLVSSLAIPMLFIPKNLIFTSEGNRTFIFNFHLLNHLLMIFQVLCLLKTESKLYLTIQIHDSF